MTYPCVHSTIRASRPAEALLRGQCSALLTENARCEHQVEIVLQVLSRVSETDPGTGILVVPICACPPCCAAGVETIRLWLERGRRDYATSEPAR